MPASRGANPQPQRGAAMAGGSVVDALRRDHETLKSHVAALDAMVQAWGASRQGTERMLNGAFHERMTYFGTEMGRHFRREEEGLFPDARRLAAAGGPGAEVIGQFFREEAEDDILAHRVLRDQVAEMLTLLTTAEAAGGLEDKAESRLPTLFRMFRTVLELHSAKEDELVFPMIERALSLPQREAALERLSVMPLDQVHEPSLHKDVRFWSG